MPDDNARIEALEADVEVLKDALRSVAEWKFRVATLRASDSSNFSAVVTGQETTREILERLN